MWQEFFKEPGFMKISINNSEVLPLWNSFSNIISNNSLYEKRTEAEALMSTDINFEIQCGATLTRLRLNVKQVKDGGGK